MQRRPTHGRRRTLHPRAPFLRLLAAEYLSLTDITLLRKNITKPHVAIFIASPVVQVNGCNINEDLLYFIDSVLLKLVRKFY